MKNKYDLDSLIDKFKSDAEEAEKDRQKMLDKFPNNKHFQNDFNFALALYHICLEIKDRRKP